MPKHPTKPGVNAVGGGSHHDDSDESERRRGCGPARAALARSEQFAQRLDDHLDEDGDRFDSLSRDVGDLRREIRGIDVHVGDLRVEVAKVSTVVEKIGDVLNEQSQIKHVTMIAEVETGKAQRIATITDATDAKKTRRAMILKAVLVMITALGTVLGMIIEHYR